MKYCFVTIIVFFIGVFCSAQENIEISGEENIKPQYELIPEYSHYSLDAKDWYIPESQQVVYSALNEIKVGAKVFLTEEPSFVIGAKIQYWNKNQASFSFLLNDPIMIPDTADLMTFWWTFRYCDIEIHCVFFAGFTVIEKNMPIDSIHFFFFGNIEFYKQHNISENQE